MPGVFVTVCRALIDLLMESGSVGNARRQAPSSQDPAGGKSSGGFLTSSACGSICTWLPDSNIGKTVSPLERLSTGFRRLCRVLAALDCWLALVGSMTKSGSPPM